MATTKKKSKLPEYTRRATKKYKSKFKQLNIQVLPEEKILYEKHLDGKSMQQYIKDMFRSDLEKKGINVEKELEEIKTSLEASELRQIENNGESEEL